MRSDSPQARKVLIRIRETRSGATSPAAPAKRSQTDCAAFTEICWPTIERASVENGSPREASATRGWRRMIRAITGSAAASARRARGQ